MTTKSSTIVDVDLTRLNIMGLFPYTETVSVEVRDYDFSDVDNLVHAGWTVKTVTIL